MFFVASLICLDKNVLGVRTYVASYRIAQRHSHFLCKKSEPTSFTGFSCTVKSRNDAALFGPNYYWPSRAIYRDSTGVVRTSFELAAHCVGSCLGVVDAVKRFCTSNRPVRPIGKREPPFFFETGHLEWRHLVERFGSCYLVGVRCWFDVSEPGDRSFSARYLIGKPITVNTPPRSSHSFWPSFLFFSIILGFPFSLFFFGFGIRVRKGDYYADV